MFKRDFFSAEQETLREKVGVFLDDNVVPYSSQWSAKGEVPRDLWRKAGSAGLLCRTVPKEYGGLGGPFTDSVIIIEELAKRRITGLFSCLQSDIVAPFLLRLGSEAQKQKFLPGFCDGNVLGAVAMTEPQSGSDMRNMTTVAERKNTGWLLEGRKTHISNGSLADIIIVAARSEHGAVGSQPGLTLLLVEGSRPGVSRSAIPKSGMPSLNTSEITFDQCVLPDNNLLGAEGMGFVYLMTFLSIERLVLAIYAQSSAEVFLSDLVRDTEERRIDGVSVLDFQNTRFKLADAFSACAANRALIDKCIMNVENGQIDPKSSCIAKLRTTETLKEIAALGVQFRGARGISGASGQQATQDLIDSSVQSIWGGTSEVMRDVIGSSLVNCL